MWCLAAILVFAFTPTVDCKTEASACARQWLMHGPNGPITGHHPDDKWLWLFSPKWDICVATSKAQGTWKRGMKDFKNLGWEVAVKPLSLIGVGRMLWNAVFWMGMGRDAAKRCLLDWDGKDAAKCCLLDTAWLLDSQAHSSSGYLRKTCVLLAHPLSVVG